MDTKNYTLSSLRKFVAPEYIYGFGSRNLVSRFAHNLSLSKILLVTDSGVIKTGWVDEIMQQLLSEGFAVTVFDNISPNPRDFEVMEGVRAFNNNQCDSIVLLVVVVLWTVLKVLVFVSQMINIYLNLKV
jgi:alcohol dehydrogenase class IV